MFLRRTYAAVFRRPKLTLEKKGTLVKIGRNILPLNLLATALLAGIRAGIAQSNVSVDSQGRLHLKVAYPNSLREIIPPDRIGSRQQLPVEQTNLNGLRVVLACDRISLSPSTRPVHP